VGSLFFAAYRDFQVGRSAKAKDVWARRVLFFSRKVITCRAFEAGI